MWGIRILKQACENCFVFALQLGGPRADSPVELELVAVEGGAKRDLFDAALHTCSNVL